jgi:hypothetical protein
MIKVGLSGKYKPFAVGPFAGPGLGRAVAIIFRGGLVGSATTT